MALKIIVTKRADKKLIKILKYLSEEWNQEVTSDFINKVYNFLDILKDFPEIGILENEKRNRRAFTIVPQVKVFYRIDFSKKRIFILNFFETRQKPSKK